MRFNTFSRHLGLEGVQITWHCVINTGKTTFAASKYHYMLPIVVSIALNYLPQCKKAM